MSGIFNDRNESAEQIANRDAKLAEEARIRESLPTPPPPGIFTDHNISTEALLASATTPSEDEGPDIVVTYDGEEPEEAPAPKAKAKASKKASPAAQKDDVSDSDAKDEASSSDES